jgi:RNA polymerase sigma-70 factor (ECF subfamily)
MEMRNRPSDTQELLWVMRAQAGDRQALEQLLSGVLGPLRRYARTLVGDADADDVAQEVLVQVYRKLDTREAPEAFRAWVLRIASRAAFRHLRRTRRWRDHARDDEALASLPARRARVRRHELPLANSIVRFHRWTVADVGTGPRR